MAKFLVLGGGGMLGHQLLKYLSAKHEVKVTLHKGREHYAKFNLFNEQNSYFDVEVKDTELLSKILLDYKPEVVINAVGVVKQRKAAKSVIPSLEINSLLPHRLALLCAEINAKLIHISTDCVFVGTKGFYTEEDTPDALDLYGQSKHWGEVTEGNALTLRTSIIGLELANKMSLIEWFLRQKGTIKGFKNAIYTGVTTLEMARVIEKIITEYPTLSGLWHLSSDAINKFDLLTMFQKKLNKDDVIIEGDSEFKCDRSLSSAKLRQKISYTPPSWDIMLGELALQVESRG